MTDDAVLVLDCLFGTIWRIFTSWYIPGTNVTPAVMGLFLISSGIGLRFVLSFLQSPNSSSALDVYDAHVRGTRLVKSDKLRDAKLRDYQRKSVVRMNDRLRQRELRESDFFRD